MARIAGTKERGLLQFIQLEMLAERLAEIAGTEKKPGEEAKRIAAVCNKYDIKPWVGAYTRHYRDTLDGSDEFKGPTIARQLREGRKILRRHRRACLSFVRGFVEASLHYDDETLKKFGASYKSSLLSGDDAIEKCKGAFLQSELYPEDGAADEINHATLKSMVGDVSAGKVTDNEVLLFLVEIDDFYGPDFGIVDHYLAIQAYYGLA